ncbi:SDR family NAD(P)-dependent oxidoreductase [Litorihabitans aurantiacus]|uniref:SDR family NAD(P)-dependent oxidoreductase n=1 Tax=Litorihabitans aurantiacus TaxID=1930061 RepID=A0AA37XED5_9MICO|nr:SDR family NAD(P)-dependent oxidoreductase [Litorihabitans aurantiacus]GMA31671.1 hypothetical protein GCM10025875_16630 [Litorihabitans aurantiacus]
MADAPAAGTDVAAPLGAPGPAAVALVTGASRGIGRSVALALAAQGLAVGLLARDGDALAQVAREIEAAGGRAAVATADVGEYAQVSAAVAHLVEALGTPDLLVNNAGRIDAEVPLWEADVEQWQGVVATNLLGSFHVSRAVTARMVAAGGGRVVDIVSGAGARDWDVTSAYTATKAAQIRTVGHLHEAGVGHGLRAFAIAPGTVETAMSTSMRLHAGRTSFTPVERTTDLIGAIARGELDDWSGTYLRVTNDTPEALAAHGAPQGLARRFGVHPWGPDDPLAAETMVPPRS